MQTDLLIALSITLLVSIVSLALLLKRYGSSLLTRSYWFYVMAALVLSAGIGAGLLQLPDPVMVFIALQLASLVLGMAHIRLSLSSFQWAKEGGLVTETLFAVFTFSLLSLGFLVTGGFALKSTSFFPVLTLGWVPFLLPLLFIYSFQAWEDIPPRIYRKWFYPVHREVPILELADTIRLHVKVSKAPDRPQLTQYTVKAPIDRTLNDLFHYMIYSHNYEEDTENPIHYHEADSEGSLLGWVFYKESFGGLSKRFLDPALTLNRNGIKANDTIIARSFISTNAYAS